MEIINITEEQRETLCKELARIVSEYKKCSGVECIYFAPYKNLGDIKSNVIQVTIVNNFLAKENLEEEISVYNLKHQSQEFVSRFGVRICLRTDCADYYKKIEMHSYEFLRSKYLFNSVILFDRNGKYNMVKDSATQDNTYSANSCIKYFSNLAEIVPPLDYELAIKIKKM